MDDVFIHLLAFVFVIGFFIFLGASGEDIDELDTLGIHNNTVRVVEIKEISPMVVLGNGSIDVDSSCNLVGDDGREYQVTGSFRDKLNDEFNGSVEGQKLNIFFENIKTRSSTSDYNVINVTTEDGKVIIFYEK